MREKPEWFKGIVENDTAAPPESAERQERDAREMAMELASARAFILDSAPEAWQERVDEDLVDAYRKELSGWNNKTILLQCTQPDLWDDPSFAKALVDVIGGKTVMVFEDNDENAQAV